MVIDGAHGLFAHDIDISSLFDKYGVDFYVGNCHKWFCSTKGLGFICVKDTRISGKTSLYLVSFPMVTAMVLQAILSGMDAETTLVPCQCLFYWNFGTDMTWTPFVATRPPPYKTASIC